MTHYVLEVIPVQDVEFKYVPTPAAYYVFHFNHPDVPSGYAVWAPWWYDLKSVRFK